METMVHKVTLSSAKEVLIRDIRIKDQEMAAQAAANSVDPDNKIALALAMQRELLKMLIVKINDTIPQKLELEDLDAIFTYSEYMELMEVIEKITGVGGKGNFQMELVASGSI